MSEVQKHAAPSSRKTPLNCNFLKDITKFQRHSWQIGPLVTSEMLNYSQTFGLGSSLTILTRADRDFNDRVADLSCWLSLGQHILRRSRKWDIQQSRDIGGRQMSTGSPTGGKWRNGKAILQRRRFGQFWQRKDWCSLLQQAERRGHLFVNVFWNCSTGTSLAVSIFLSSSILIYYHCHTHRKDKTESEWVSTDPLCLLDDNRKHHYL